MIDFATAMMLNDSRTTLYHGTLRNADGTALRARVNGKIKTWKTRPQDFRLPMKHGLRDCFYLTPDNAEEWHEVDPTEYLPPNFGIERMQTNADWLIAADCWEEMGETRKAAVLRAAYRFDVMGKDYQPSEAELDYAYGVHGGSRVGGPEPFPAWMEKVDGWLQDQCGVQSDDLRDKSWHVWYDEGATPAQAGQMALEEKGLRECNA